MSIPSQASPEEIERIRREHLDIVAPGEPISKAQREAICFDFSDCSHVEERLVPIGDNWVLAICVRCAHVNSRQCSHLHCEWLFEGKLLVCPTCGVDAT